MLSIDYNDVFANETTAYLPVEMFKSYTTDRDAQIDEMFESKKTVYKVLSVLNINIQV